METMTQSDQFLSALLSELQARYEWAKDENKLSNFMRCTYLTIVSSGNHVNLGDSHQAAWKAIGKPGRVTFKGLKTLRD